MSKNQPAPNVFLAFIELARMRIVVMVLVACSIGFILAYRGECPVLRFLWTLLGTALVTGGACTLNCYLEREADALMSRTCGRPIPAGVVSPAAALWYGVILVSSGCL